MQITSVTLDNIKSYRHITVPLRKGTTAIRGENGAGKSTLVEAIGFALFDTINYKQAQFVREGEKTGQVTIGFVSALDDREYEVVRKCGNSSDWYVHDPELHDRIVEQRADVLAFLRQHLRIEGEISLSALFSDAIGVAQGTFTADFLETPANRKKKFDALLEVEEYQKAADRLKYTKDYLTEQRHEQERRIDALERETSQLDGWKQQLDENRANERELAAKIVRLEHERDIVEQRRKALAELDATVQRLAGEEQVARIARTAAETREREAAARVAEARTAVAVCETTRADHDAYAAAEQALVAAAERQRTRNRLREQRAAAAQRFEVARRDLEHAREQLARAAAAERRIVELAPAVERQQTLERERDDAQQRLQQREAARKTLSAKTAEREQLARQIEGTGARLADLERLRPLAAQLAERRAELERLQAAAATRAEREKRLTTLRAEQARAQRESDDAAARATKASANVRKCLALGEAVERFPALQATQAQLEREVRQLEVALEHHRQSRQQSGKGHCPFLAEPCLNIQRRGENSLASYFDRLIQEDEAKLAPARARLEQMAAEVEQVRKMCSYYERLEMYREQQRQEEEKLEQAQARVARLAQERAEIEQQLASAPDTQALQQARQRFAESDVADKQLATLTTLEAQQRDQRQRLSALAGECAALDAQVSTLASADADLERARTALIALGDPRSAHHVALQAARERPALEARVTAVVAALHEREAEVVALDAELLPFAAIDDEVRQLETRRHEARAGHTRYLQHERLAATLPEAETAHAAAQAAAQQAQAAHEATRMAYEQTAARFDASELACVSQQADALRTEWGEKTEKLRNTQAESVRLEHDIERVAALLEDLRAARDELSTLAELDQMLKQFRETIKEAGPNIMRALLHQISLEANRIFGEILGDRSAQLLWLDDYEIVLRRDGRDRSFAQLSGGEQMSAALAVRLALLRSLSGLDIAFFDEPTQNMDGERRGNLAEQIRRVHGFEQIVVISHDDTFEQGLDAVIHLEKRNGETALIEDEALVLA